MEEDQYVVRSVHCRFHRAYRRIGPRREPSSCAAAMDRRRHSGANRPWHLDRSYHNPAARPLELIGSAKGAVQRRTPFCAGGKKALPTAWQRIDPTDERIEYKPLLIADITSIVCSHLTTSLTHFLYCTPFNSILSRH